MVCSEFSSEISLRQEENASEEGDSNQGSVHARDGGWPVFRGHPGYGDAPDVVPNAGNASAEERRNKLQQDQREE